MDKKKKYFLISLLALVCSFVFFTSYAFLLKKPLAEISSSGRFLVWAELAISEKEQARGLMFRKHLRDDRGMLFVFSDEGKRFFWMKNTLIPLDLFFVSSDFRIVDIKKGLQPCKSDPCPTYESAFPARYVLEVNAGLADRQVLKVGDKINIKLK